MATKHDNHFMTAAEALAMPPEPLPSFKHWTIDYRQLTLTPVGAGSYCDAQEPKSTQGEE